MPCRDDPVQAEPSVRAVGVWRDSFFMIVRPMDTEEQRMNEARRALAHHDRSLGASSATEQAVMARWDAEHVGRSNRARQTSR
jgi:hypothetical protein